MLVYQRVRESISLYINPFRKMVRRLCQLLKTSSDTEQAGMVLGKLPGRQVGYQNQGKSQTHVLIFFSIISRVSMNIFWSFFDAWVVWVESSRLFFMATWGKLPQPATRRTKADMPILVSVIFGRYIADKYQNYMYIQITYYINYFD